MVNSGQGHKKNRQMRGDRTTLTVLPRKCAVNSPREISPFPSPFKSIELKTVSTRFQKLCVSYFSFNGLSTTHARKTMIGDLGGSTKTYLCNQPSLGNGFVLLLLVMVKIFLSWNVLKCQQGFARTGTGLHTQNEF